jgi:hypothetical protein
MLGVPEAVVWARNSYVGSITSKHHRDQLQGAPLSLSPHERATNQQSREKTRSIEC